MTVGLESIFSVLIDLNRRDVELCVKALQSLLQLLQNLPAEILSAEPRTVVERMHNLLKQLRVEGALKSFFFKWHNFNVKCFSKKNLFSRYNFIII